jgi:LDH2 family malate/lactate/ureidoglycolate dehydrogenase
LSDLRRSKPLPGRGPIRLPGDARAARRQERLAEGVPIPAELLSQLDRLAGQLSIPPLQSRR